MIRVSNRLAPFIWARRKVRKIALGWLRQRHRGIKIPVSYHTLTRDRKSVDFMREREEDF